MRNMRKHKHSCRFLLGPNRKSVVEKANGQSACNTSDRPDQNEHVRGVEVADRQHIFASGFRRNPVLGSARP